MKFRVYVQRLTTYEVECGSEEEARAIVTRLQHATPAPEGDGAVKVEEAIAVTL